jgi:hypothetical protein
VGHESGEQRCINTATLYNFGMDAKKECGLALVFAFLACSVWLMLPARRRASTWVRAKQWGRWLFLALVGLACVTVGQAAARLRPQHVLPYYPWRDGLPSERSGHAMATMGDGSVWMFGGSDNFMGWSSELVKLDPVERRWHPVTTSGPRPSARFNHALVAVKGTSLLLFGGNTGSSLSNELWSFDLLAAVWRQLTAQASAVFGPWPSAREGHAMVTINQTTLLVFGGSSEGFGNASDFNVVWSLDVSVSAVVWRKLTASVSSKRPSVSVYQAVGQWAMIAVTNNSVLLFGASTVRQVGSHVDEHDGMVSELAELWSLDVSVPAVAWRQLTASASGPPSLSGHAMVALDSRRVLLFGGHTSCVWMGARQLCPNDKLWVLELSDLWSLDQSSVPAVVWRQLTVSTSGQTPSARYGHSIIAVNSSRVLLFGGITGSGPLDGEAGNQYELWYNWTSGRPSNELWCCDLVPSTDSTVRWTLLNDVGVTADELWRLFNNPQVHTAL